MGTDRVRVNLPRDGGERSYHVLIQDGLLDELPVPGTGSLFIVTDSNVSRLYGKAVLRRLSGLGRRVRMTVFPAGERNKNIRTASKVASDLSRLGADRESTILALGGGVVGDLAGFVASIYKRGIDYIQIPTTRLAQVDSSIGGKTGIDAPWGKNQIGTFHQPKGVLTDPRTLRTLPPPEILNGMAEIVKCAIIADREMFDALFKLRNFDSIVPTNLIVRACMIKAKVVSEDEKEDNYRAILNFGHTVGHSLESALNYRLGHGACVILGMLAESWISAKMGILEDKDFERESELLRKLSQGLDVRVPQLDTKALFQFARSDKKSTSNVVRMSLPASTGKMHTTDDGMYKIPVSRKDFEGSIDYVREIFA
jgi:3-dehydroquinate synthase